MREFALSDIVKPGRLFIGGRFVESRSGKTFETLDPATGRKLTDVAEGDAVDVDLAVRAARAAFDDPSGPWRKMAARDRGLLLLRAASILLDRADEAATLESLDTGKPVLAARNDDIGSAVETLRYFGGLADKIEGETIPVRGPYLNYTLREPVGVVAAIIPWNFPLLLATWKIAPALAAGNTVVLKPAEETPLTALLLAEVMKDAGLPEGVLNVVAGFGETAGAALVRHEGVDKVAFTGSTETGREIMRAAAGTLKRLTLELGGKSPNIVFADAPDLARAVEGAASGIFYNQGEVCCAGSRIFVEAGVHRDFAAQLAKRAADLKVGPPLDRKTEMGALISPKHMEKVLSYIEAGKSEGAALLAGGSRAAVAGCEGGWFVQPTVFDGARNEMRIAREEIFGPVATLIPFSSEADLVAQANDTRYGLAAAVWTRDGARAHRLARALRAGTVWINCIGPSDPASPFGGFKLSGFGRDLSRHAIDAYTEVKSVWYGLR